MHIGKVIISLFLLLIYSVGFGHTLIPHQEKNDAYIQNNTFQENEHHHQHHEHEQNEDSGTNHVHIPHENHFDESIIDLIACFLCAMDYPSNDCDFQHYIPEKTRESANSNFAKAKFATMLLAVFFIAKQAEPISAYRSWLNVCYTTPPLEKAPHRGPPTLT